MNQDAELLYNLQMLIKKDYVNHQKKVEEVQRLCCSYNKQIQSYMYSQYVSGIHIWTVLNSENKKIASNIPPEPTKINTNPDLMKCLWNLRKDPSKLIEMYGKQDKLTLNGFLMTLSLFSFCWSEEEADSVALFISQLPDDKSAELFCQCLLVHPLIQNYFILALKPVFKSLQKKKNERNPKKNAHYLKLKLIKSLKKLSPILPEFFKFILKNTSGNRSLFYNVFLKNFIDYHLLFGIGEPDADICAKDDLSMLINSLSRYFDNEKSDELLEKICSNEQNSIICILPSEKKIQDIDVNYQSLTLLESRWLCEVDPSLRVIAKLCFVPLSYSKIPESGSFINEKLSLPQIIHKFLIKADLVKLQEKFPNVIDYFQKLADLSSEFGDPELEKDIESMYNSSDDISKLTMEGICKSIEEEFLNKEKDNKQNPLKEISSYSSQYSYINMLKELVLNLPKNHENMVDFNTIVSLIQKYMSDPQNKIPTKEEVYSNPSTFVTLFKQINQKISTDNSLLGNSSKNTKNIHLILIHHYNILQHLKNELSEKDKKISQILSDKRDILLDTSQNDFLKTYEKNPEKLNLFINEFIGGLNIEMPLACVSHINKAYLVLVELLQLQKIDEVGADQIVPFALYATVLSNPQTIFSTFKYISSYVQTIPGLLDPPEEYSMTQFSSTYHYLEEKMEQ